MPKCRVDLVNQAFMKMDRSRDGYITVSDLRFTNYKLITFLIALVKPLILK